MANQIEVFCGAKVLARTLKLNGVEYKRNDPISKDVLAEVSRRNLLALEDVRRLDLYRTEEDFEEAFPEMDEGAEASVEETDSEVKSSKSAASKKKRKKKSKSKSKRRRVKRESTEEV